MTEFIILFPFTFALISKKTVFFKDPTEVIPSTLLVFFTFLSLPFPNPTVNIKAILLKTFDLTIPPLIINPLAFILPDLRLFYMAGAVLLFLTLFSGSLIDNRFKLTHSLFSFLIKLIAGFLTFFLTITLFRYWHITEPKDLYIYTKIIALTGCFLILLRFISKTRETFERRLRIGNEYIYTGRILLTGGLAGGLYLIFKGNLLTALKVIISCLLLYWSSRWVFKRTIRSYIKDLIKRLGEKPWQYRIRVFSTLEIEGPNAFAYYEGERKAIGITEDFIKRFNSDEINFAIAHELAHHREEHSIVRVWTEILSRAGLSLLFWAFKISTFSSFLISSLVHIAKKTLYKSEEEEADLLAIDTLKKAGLSQRGGETFFLKLLKGAPPRRGVFKKIINAVLEDHPLPEKRLEKIKGLIAF